MPNISNKMTSIAVGVGGNGVSSYGSTNQASRRQIINYPSFITTKYTSRISILVTKNRRIIKIANKSLKVSVVTYTDNNILILDKKAEYAKASNYILAPSSSDLYRNPLINRVSLDVTRPSTRQQLSPQADTRHINQVDFRSHRIINPVPYYYGVSSTIYTNPTSSNPTSTSSGMMTLKSSSYPVLPTVLPPYLMQVDVRMSYNMISQTSDIHRIIRISDVSINQRNIIRANIEL